MENELLKILAILEDYAKRHDIIDGITLQLESDGSGNTIYYVSKENIFHFDTIGELIEILKV